LIATENFVQLHRKDNILVCRKRAMKGLEIIINEQGIPLNETIDVGHKIACELINKDEKVIKYGVIIGSAMRLIMPGEHVHLSNLQSDYIDSHTRTGVISQSKILGYQT